MNAEGLIVVGVDGSESSRHAADWAAEVASAQGAPLLLVHAVPAGGGEADEPVWLREVHDAAERAGVEKVETRIVPGPAADVLVGCSRDAGMLVVGSYGEHARSGMLAGSVALALVESAPPPVAVVRGSAPGLAPPRSGPVLVGTEAPPSNDRALDLGARLADALGCRLSVLHAWSDVSEDAEGLHRSTASGTELAAAAVKRLDTALEAVRMAHPTLPIDRHVVDDTALRALLDAARDARMIVIGHRRGVQAAYMLGSTSRGLVGFAPCSVIVV
jgi:nucleotide-binding universal stress UspA family protein